MQFSERLGWRQGAVPILPHETDAVGRVGDGAVDAVCRKLAHHLDAVADEKFIRKVINILRGRVFLRSGFGSTVIGLGWMRSFLSSSVMSVILLERDDLVVAFVDPSCEVFCLLRCIRLIIDHNEREAA